MPFTRRPATSTGTGTSAGMGGRPPLERQKRAPLSLRGKCTDVALMLVERLKTRNDWSVDEEQLAATHTMNVWQTLELIASANQRKRYYYDGYCDTANIVRTLTPSWRRDSFAEKAAEDGIGQAPSTAVTVTAATAAAAATSVRTHKYSARQNDQAVRCRGESAETRPKCHRTKKKTKPPADGLAVELDAEYALSPADYADLIKCNFNLPRISACLERLMGTNVVRLTDRKYMKDLRDRIEEDYRTQLQKRITARELKEVERERLLIIEGKSDIIPDELSEDPIFVVNKTANKEILKERSKLRTNREKNSERLKLQGIKWERERLQHEEEERQRLEVLHEHRKKQKDLEERYRTEDGERGMDLLRIHSEDWRECEQDLKEFLHRERKRMKERSRRVPTPYSSDSLDIQNIVRARQKFRQTELRIRHELEQKHKDDTQYTASKQHSAKSAASKVSKAIADLPLTLEIAEDAKTRELGEDEDEKAVRKRMSDDASDTSVESELQAVGSTISESKRRHAIELEKDMEADVQSGLLISKQQFNHLRYEEEKIVKLRHAMDIRELYQLAEDIIIGERIEEEAVEEEAEAVGEEGEEGGEETE